MIEFLKPIEVIPNKIAYPYSDLAVLPQIDFARIIQDHDYVKFLHRGINLPGISGRICLVTGGDTVDSLLRIGQGEVTPFGELPINIAVEDGQIVYINNLPCAVSITLEALDKLILKRALKLGLEVIFGSKTYYSCFLKREEGHYDTRDTARGKITIVNTSYMMDKMGTMTEPSFPYVLDKLQQIGLKFIDKHSLPREVVNKISSY